MDCENQEKDKDGNSTTTGAFNNSNTNNSECSRCCEARRRSAFPPDFQLISGFAAGIQTIDSTQALFLPIGASVSLLVMFFFFDSVQVVFTICTAGERGRTRALPINGASLGLTGAAFQDSLLCFLPLCPVLATIAFAFLLLPMCQYLTRPCSPQNK